MSDATVTESKLCIRHVARRYGDIWRLPDDTSDAPAGPYWFVFQGNQIVARESAERLSPTLVSLAARANELGGGAPGEGFFGIAHADAVLPHGGNTCRVCIDDASRLGVPWPGEIVGRRGVWEVAGGEPPHRWSYRCREHIEQGGLSVLPTVLTAHYGAEREYRPQPPPPPPPTPEELRAMAREEATRKLAAALSADGRTVNDGTRRRAAWAVEALRVLLADDAGE